MDWNRRIQTVFQRSHHAAVFRSGIARSRQHFRLGPRRPGSGRCGTAQVVAGDADQLHFSGSGGRVRDLLLEPAQTVVRHGLLGPLLRGELSFRGCDVVGALLFRHHRGTQAGLRENVRGDPAGSSRSRRQSPPQPSPRVLSCVVRNQLLARPSAASSKGVKNRRSSWRRPE